MYSCLTELFEIIGLVGRVFANGPVDLGSIPGRVIPKTLKMVLDTSLLNTQQYKVCIKGKVEKSRERSSALPDTSVYSLLKRETSGRPRLRSPTLPTICIKTYLALINLQTLICHKTQTNKQTNKHLSFSPHLFLVRYNRLSAESADAVEYTNCISAEG